MKIFGKTSTAIMACMALVLCAGMVLLYQKYKEKELEAEDLKAQLATLRQSEAESAVMRSINAQMEKIANQERRISDEQREQADQQRRVAEEMRSHAEVERQNAVEAEHRAVDASRVAEKERSIAENQRMVAEHQKRVADTLSYLTLAQQLGYVATKQQETGNTELASLLAYAACLYNNRYQGDIYHPAIYRSLVITSHGHHKWKKHKGWVSDITFYHDNPNRFISCSTYGELMEHTVNGDNLNTKVLVSNKQFDFRDVTIAPDNKHTFAVSREGHIILLKGGQINVIDATAIAPLVDIEILDGRLVIFGKKAIALIAPERLGIEQIHSLPFSIVCVSREGGHPCMFDDKGQMHVLKSMDKYESSKVPFKGQVTTYGCSSQKGFKVYGMQDGTIWIAYKNGKTQRLNGHRSRITDLRLNGWIVYSSSYDGNLNLWKVNESKIEPITIISTTNWIIDFTLASNNSNIWCGDQDGYLFRTVISVPQMIASLKRQLKRNLTREEWNYYIGKNIPYETFIGKEATP